MQPNENGAAKFNPPANIPQEISLKWTDGLPCQSPYNGDQVLFRLDDGRKWYVDPQLAERIRALQLEPGEVFSVTRKEIARGNRRTFTWEVDRAVGTGADAPAPVQPTSTPKAQSQSSSTHSAVSPEQRAHPNPNPPTIEGAIRNSLLLTGKLAVDAALEVEAYARERGIELQFDAPTLQDVWVSAFIQFHRGGTR